MAEHAFHVELEKHKIFVESCPPRVKKELKFMTEHFLEIKTIK